MVEAAVKISAKTGVRISAGPDLSAVPAMSVKIAVRNLHFYYEDGNHALKNISVPIYAQSVTASIGPSDCDKATLLRVFNRKCHTRLMHHSKQDCYSITSAAVAS